MTFRTGAEAEPLRAVVAGGGFHGRRWNAVLRARPDVVLLDPLDPASAAGQLDAERPDLLVNCATAEVHTEVGVAALERAVSVLDVGPAAAPYQEARALAAAADRAGALLVFGQQHRALTALGELRGQLAALGRLGLLSVEFAAPRRSWTGPGSWADPLLRQVAVQLFDMAGMITGCELLSVCCTGTDPVAGVGRLTGGVPFLFGCDWSGRGEPSSWYGRWHAVGALGTARWDGPGEGQPETPDPAGVLDGLVAALRSGTPPPGEPHTWLRSLAAVESAAQSAASGQLEAVRG
ncbi:putative dehydrogenase [Streptomyces sp. 846.5]|nr:hypothetical protein [Streptomyces sp. 846.5]TDU01731.1 putative dehydrogenase [Streptomyces sp. 846.5]